MPNKVSKPVALDETLQKLVDAVKGKPSEAVDEVKNATSEILYSSYLANLNGMNTTHLFNVWWSQRSATESKWDSLEKWFTLLQKAWVGKKYTLRAYTSAASGDSSMTPLDDLADGRSAGVLTTAATGALDWTEEDPMCWYVRANALSLADGTMNIVAVEGEDSFDVTGETAPVYAFSLALYRKRWTSGSYEYKSWSANPASGYMPYAGDVAPDGNKRVMTWHSCFCGGLTSDGKLTSGAGRKVNNFKSAVTGNTEVKKWNAYEGLWNDCDMEWLLDMWQLRHWNKENSSILEGCQNYNYQYKVAAAENGVKRVLLTSTQAANIIVGSTVSVGNNSESNTDRNSSGMRNIADLVIVQSKTTVGSNVAINLELPSTVNIPATAYISTMPWHSGTTENVSGHKDGCIGSLTTGQYPIRVAGVEVLNGAYTIGLEPLYNVTANGSNFDFAVYECRNSEKLAGSITSDYINTGITLKNVIYQWNYIKSFAHNDLGIVFPAEITGADSSSYFKSAFYGAGSAGVRCPWRFGHLNHGAPAGLACESGNFSPSGAYWNGVPRVGGSGKKRGEWIA